MFNRFQLLLFISCKFLHNNKNFQFALTIVKQFKKKDNNY